MINGRMVAVALGVVCAVAAVAGAEPKVEEQVVGPAGRVDFKYSLSARGLHLGSVTMKGSRFVVVVDGVEGPQFDEVYATAPKFQDLADMHGELTQHAVTTVGVVAFSPDGGRHAYAARDGKDVVLIVDGKETFRAPYSPSRAVVNVLSFSPDGKHVYFHTPTTDTMYSTCLVMDGQRGPACAELVWPVFSSDGAHWAYYGKRPTPGQESFTVVDGKMADYHAGRLRYLPDGKRLVGVSAADGKQTLVVDGKPLGPAGQVERIAISSTGDIAATTVIGAARQLYLNGQAVPGTEGAFSAVFSPNGKRIGVRCVGGSPVQGWQVIDGKKGREYSGVEDCVFTADSSKVIYVAEVQNTRFVVVDGQESEGYQAMLTKPTVSAAGAHYAYVAATAKGRQLVVDDKAYPAGRDVEGFAFSPDGSRHAFLASMDLVARTLVVDGKTSAAPVMAGTPVLFSPDGKRVATIAAQPGTRNLVVLIDDQLIPLPMGADQVKLCAFTPDGNHLVWRCGQQQKDGKATADIYVDGQRVAQFERISVGLPQELSEMGADGTFVVMGTAVGGAAIKRVRVTPSADTSLATWAADVKAGQEKAAAAAAQKLADDKGSAEKAAADAKAAREKAVADRKAAMEKATADRKAAYERAQADRKAAAEKAAADRAAKRKPQ